MPINKNQHFVPQCYLKSFSNVQNRRSINLFNLPNSMHQPKASIKAQCSKNNFYGNVQEIENMIQNVERDYASAINKIYSNPRQITNEIKKSLINFWYFQYLRTDEKSKNFINMSKGFDAKISEHNKVNPEHTLNHEQAVFLNLSIYAEQKYILDGLKACLVKNETSTPFITSDNPAIHTNKFWYQNPKLSKHHSFGLGTSGMLGILPINDKLLLLVYDENIYSIPNTSGIINCKKSSDITFFNQFQILNCQYNLYFKNVTELSYVTSIVNQFSPNRVIEKHSFDYAVLENNDDEQMTFRVLHDGETEEHNSALIVTNHNNPKIINWPSIIKFRDKKISYTNGVPGIFLRACKGMRITDSSFYKIKI